MTPPAIAPLFTVAFEEMQTPSTAFSPPPHFETHNFGSLEEMNGNDSVHLSTHYLGFPSSILYSEHDERQ